MEGDRRFGSADSDITALQNSELRLKYLTREARRIVDGMGLRDLTIFYQVRLMEDCYNYNADRIEEHLKRKRDEYSGIGHNALITKLSEQSSLRKPKQVANASFNVNGICNLYTLDATLVVADYGVNLQDLAKELNALTPTLLTEWLATIPETKLSMPIALYRLQEFLSMMRESDIDLRRALIEVPKYPPIGDAERAILEAALKELRATQRVMKMEDEDGTH